MAQNRVNIWYDRQGDFLEVVWADKPGEFIDSPDGRAYVKVDADGNVLGFQVLGLSRVERFLDLELDGGELLAAPDREV